MAEHAYKEVGGDFGVTPRWEPEATTEFEKESTQYLGNVIEGRYVEKLEGIGQKGATMYVLEDCTAGEEKFEKLSVFGTTVLDGKFMKVKPGSQVRITHLGMQKAKKGGNDYRGFRLEAAPPAMQEVLEDET